MKLYLNEMKNLLMASDMLDRSYAEVAKKHGLKDNTLALLYALNSDKEYCQTDLSREWNLPKTTLNTIVKECVAEGIITMENRQHVKEKYIRLTEKGQNYIAKVLKPIYEAEACAYEETIKKYPPEFIDAFSAFAENIRCELKKRFNNGE